MEEKLKKISDISKRIIHDPMIVTYYIANMIDAFMTLYCVQNGLAEEGNSILQPLLEQPALFIAVKAIIPIFVCVLLSRINKKWFSCCCATFMISVVVWNTLVIALW